MKYLIFVLVLLVSTIQSSYALPSLTNPEGTKVESTTDHQPSNNSFLTPIKRQITKWSIVINREIPKRMKKLKNNPSVSVIFATAFSAFLYGIFHTLGPGHGKMVVATYFLSNGTNIARGAWVGSQVALSHVGGAVFIVLFTDVALKNIISAPASQAFFVKGISYALIMCIGAFMAFQAICKIVHKHENVHTCGHCAKQHHYKNQKETLLSWAIGAVPCTGSLLILLYAMAYNVLWLGLFMVFCIAIGMAVAMTVIGIICIAGKQNVIDRMSSRKANSKLQPSLEFLGSLVIITIGYLFLSTLLSMA